VTRHFLIWEATKILRRIRKVEIGADTDLPHRQNRSCKKKNKCPERCGQTVSSQTMAILLINRKLKEQRAQWRQKLQPVKYPEIFRFRIPVWQQKTIEAQTEKRTVLWKCPHQDLANKPIASENWKEWSSTMNRVRQIFLSRVIAQRSVVLPMFGVKCLCRRNFPNSLKASARIRTQNKRNITPDSMPGIF